MAKKPAAKPATKEVNTRHNGKAFKKKPKTFDPVKRRLVTKG